MELSKRIPDAPEYIVYSDGRVYSEKTGTYMCPFLAGKYYAIKINNKNRYVHSIVAKLFVSGYFPGAEVNHIDENKMNNRAENLEWVSHKENCNHGTRNARAGLKHRKAVEAVKNGDVHRRFASISEAAKLTGICLASISKAALGSAKQAGGYEWRFA